jgi:hypothetical protein
MARKPSMADAVLAPEPMPAPPQPPKRIAKPRSPGREGKRGVAFWVSPEAAKQLRILAATSERTTQDLMEEAMSDLFRKNGLHRIV